MIDFAVSQLPSWAVVFRISGFTEPKKLAEIPLKLFHVHVQQDAMGVHHTIFLLGFEEKNFFLLCQFKINK